MALVAYDNSDSSEYEDDENESTPVIVLPKITEEKVDIKPNPNASKAQANGQEPDVERDNLFNLLPQPSAKKPAVIEEDDEFLHKKETAPIVAKPKAKISVPSLNDFKDVEERPMAKPKTSNGKKSGLLSILPQPRNAVVSVKTTSMVPHVLTKKPSTPLVPTSVKKDVIPSPMKKAKTETKSLINYSDESDNDDETTDFFSINKTVELPPVEDVPLDIDLEIKSTKAIPEKKGIESYFKKEITSHMQLQPDYSQEDEMATEYYNGIEAASTESNSHTEPESSGSNDAVLDEEALRQLVGSRGKRKKEEIQIVDVNQQEVLADSREWLLKGLMDDTSKRVSASKKKGNEPTNQQKRKHQITYLAHQAKAKESELQNQWANNRMSRRQTQSKYGF